MTEEPQNDLSRQVDAAFAALDEDALVELGMELTDIPSPTGHEEEVARFYHERLLADGLHSRLQPVAPGRRNVLGVLEGTGGGKTLMFNGHLDTSLSGDEPGVEGAGYAPSARIVDGEWIYGMGIFNMKGALAAYHAAVTAIQRADIDLAGDVVIAAVAGEIEKSPVDRFSGDDYQGYGVGTKYLLTHGGIADMCVLGEPTFMRVVPAHGGTTWVRIDVTGGLVHTAWSDRVGNAVEQAAEIVQALRDWIPDYKKRYSTDGYVPQVNIAAIQGGWPWRAARTPAGCSIFLDVRTPPDVLPIEVRDELREVVRTVRIDRPDIDARVEPYVTNPGTALPDDAPIVRAVRAAHEDVTGDPPETTIANWYSDAAHLNRYGIPAVNYGPGGRVRTGGEGWSKDEGEHLYIPDLVACTKVYIDLILRVCGATTLLTGRHDR